MTPSRRLLRTTGAAVAAALVLASCTSTEDGQRSEAEPSAAPPSVTAPPTPASSQAPAPSRRPSLPPEAAPPAEGACYRLGFDDATQPTSDREPVACDERHTARTYVVGRLDTVVDGHLLAVDSRVAQEQVQAACPRRLAAFVGGTPRDRRLSRLRPVWFSPTIEQSDLGASWFRCDVVALGRGSTLVPLPPRPRGILDRPGGLDAVGLCGTAAPGAPGFERTICSRPHSWRALTTIDIDGPDRYPGHAQVRQAGEERCRELVRRASGDPERFRYGWEWPTREQWRDGQRYGYCWAPG